MLKISVARTDTECRLLLEGALVGVGLEELRTMGNRLRRTPGAQITGRYKGRRCHQSGGGERTAATHK